MKNFLIGFLSCLCLTLLVIQSYMVFCPHSKLHRDIHVINQMLLPYDGFVLKPLKHGSIVPYNKFPFMSQEKDENINKDKDVLPKFVE